VLESELKKEKGAKFSKKQELTAEEAMEQIFATSYKFLNDSTEAFIEFYDYKYKMLRREVIEHEKKEPLKIFKRTHKNWESIEYSLSLWSSVETLTYIPHLIK